MSNITVPFSNEINRLNNELDTLKKTILDKNKQIYGLNYVIIEQNKETHRQKLEITTLHDELRHAKNESNCAKITLETQLDKIGKIINHK